MCCPTDSRRQPAWPYWLCTALLAVLYIAMYWLHPTVIEDSGISIWIKDYMDSPTIKGLWESLRICFYNFIIWDNGRLANIIVLPTLLLLPQWVTALIFGLGAALMTALGAKLSGVWRTNFFAFAILGFCLTFMLPYFDSMFVRAYASNYILSSVISIFAMWLFVRNKTNAFLMALLGLIVGAWHEGFAAAVLGAAVMTIIVFKPFRNIRSLLFVLGIIAGIVYLFNVPGTKIRLSNYETTRLQIILNGDLLFGIPFYLTVATYLCSIWWKKLRPILWRPLPFALFIASGSGWIVWRAFHAGGYRTAWPMLLFVSLYFACIIAQITFTHKKGFSYAAIFLWAIVFAHLISILPWFYRMHSENKAIESPWRWNHEAVFAPFTTQFDAPWYTLGKPSFTINAMYIWNGNRVWAKAIIPDYLRHFQPEDAKDIESDLGLYRYGTQFIIGTPDICDSQKAVDLEVFFGTKKKFTKATLVPFRTDDGHDYVWCCINGLYFDCLFDDITRIDFNLKQ